jgi:urea transport system substrate-binding protein
MSLSEPDIRSLDLKGVAGDYLAGSYFESVGSASGQAFMAQFRQRYGQERRYSDQLAAAYGGVHLWAKAATKAGSLEPDAVLKAIRGMTFLGPAGEITIDPDNQHCWLPSRIGQIQPDGSVKSVWGSDQPIRPEPFPATRTKSEWDHFLNNLFLKWDGQWQPSRP